VKHLPTICYKIKIIDKFFVTLANKYIYKDTIITKRTTKWWYKMVREEGLFLKTGLSQINTTEKIVDKLKLDMSFLAYNIKRYKIPVTLVLIYTQEDISKSIKESIRVSDKLKTIKIGESYFNFIFLLFTNEMDSYSFIKTIEKTKLTKIKSFFYFKELEPIINNYFNFINSYLFEIKKEEAFF